MQYITQSESERFENGPVTSWEYDMIKANLNVAPITIHGRYPEDGFTSNTLSDSIVHVTDGEGILGLKDGTTHNLSKNDQIHLAVGDAYYFEGDLKIIYAATPRWTPAQTLKS